MEKIINITTSTNSNTEKKNTKKKDDINKKANINAILEKYNLKAPKSKLAVKPIDYKIIPKSEDQIIHIAKKPQPIQQPNQQPRPPSPQPIQQPIQQPRPPTPIQPRPPTPPPRQPTLPPQQRPPPPRQQQIVTIPTNKNAQTNIQSLIDNDKKIKEQQKNIIPQAIISKNNPKDFMSSGNIYNMIPTINPMKQYSHLENQNKTKPIVKNTETQSGIFKKISINPNLSEEESQNYKGGNQNTKSIQQQQQQQQQPQVRSIQQQPQVRSIQQQPQVRSIQQPQIRSIQIQNKDNVSKSKNNISNNSVSNNSESNTLTNLEIQRNELQEQQRKELAKLKFKKQQILSIHNRKKEIELMKSIDEEKQKLRIIQNKQNEFNTIMEKQLKNTNTIHGTTSKQIPKHLIYNVDAKKTKKNVSLMKDVVDVIKPNENTTVTHIKPMKNFNTNFVTNTETKDVKPIKEPKVIDTVKEKEQVKEPVKETVKVKDKSKKTKDEPYKYYTKKDIHANKLDIYWGTNEELYDTKTFTETLNMSLSIQPIFKNYKTILEKDKTSLKDKQNILKSMHNFKHIDKFSENITDIIYKILTYDDNIKFEIVYKLNKHK